MKKFWRQLDGIGKVCVSVIALLALVSLFAYAFIPDKTANANTMHIRLAAQPPGTAYTVFQFPQKETDQSFISAFFYGKKQAAVQEVIVDYKTNADTLFYQQKVGGPWQSVISPTGFAPADLVLQKTFLLGSDNYGRDFFSRLVLGARVSLAVGFIAVAISLLIGIPLGAIAGYYRGKFDAAIMWLINVIWSIPTLLLVIALTFVLGKGFWQVFVAVGLTMWVEVARVVRGQVISLREKEFVEAATVLGYSNFRILFKHVLPNALSPVIVISAANFASAILIESGLSFLGIGAQPPVASWGGMIRDHYAYLIMGKPYLALLPGAAIMLAVLAFMALGNSLRDALDVKLKVE